MHPLRLLPVALGLLVAVPAAHAADPAPAPAEIARAIQQGSDFVKARAKDAFEDETFHETGELTVLTLAHCGANMKDDAFAKGLAFLEKVEPRYTYRTALLAMALAEVNPRRYQWKIAHCAQWLVDTQLAGGEWGYPGTVQGSQRKPEGVRVAPPPPPEGTEPGAAPLPQARILVTKRSSITTSGVARGDFSNTQFAILGLRACREAGVEVPKETWKAALDYVRKWQRPDGGWGYVIAGEPDESSYASLTCAGVCSLAIALNALGTKDVKADAGLKKGLGWLDGHLDLAQNVGIEASSVLGPSPWQYYHLYSLERVGRVLSLDTVGKHAWYAEGARWLLSNQQGDGHWADAEIRGSRPSYFTVADTCFALLFLTRATRPITGP